MKLAKLIKNSIGGGMILLGLGLATTPSQAIVITPTTDVNTLVNTVTAGSVGIHVTGFGLFGHATPGGAFSSGTFTNASGVYGINPGIVISTGNVLDYQDGPNLSGSTSTSYGSSATSAQESLLDPITGGFFDHFDVTQLDINFNADPGFDEVVFQVVFGSEEFFEFVGSSFIDGFGLYLNGTNIAFTGVPATIPLNINHPDAVARPGTELDGVVAPGGVLPITFRGPVNSTGNTLTFIVADTSDGVLDTTVYISSLSGPGVSQDLPFLPDDSDDGTFTFEDVPSGVWFDPPSVEGFEYAMTGGSLFTKILGFPTGFSNPFTVSVGGTVLGQFSPGNVADFTTFPGGGVPGFKITGIDPLVDLGDPTAFPLQIEFNTPTASFQMTPITVPEPSAIFGLGVLGFGAILKHNLAKSNKSNKQDK